MTSLPPSATHRIRSLAALVLVYLAVTVLTQARFMGDTIDYVIEVFAFDRRAWDFGHLWWVPLGWLLSGGGRLELPGTGNDARTTVVLLFLAINWISGLACVLLLRSLLLRLGCKEGLTLIVAIGFLFAQGFLNFAQTGSSYIPGLAFVLLALSLALDDVDTPSRSIGAGLSLAAAVCFWFPYVLVVPGVVLAPLILHGWTRARFWFTFRMGAAFGVLLVIAYGLAAVSLGIASAAEFRAWMAKSSHGAMTRGAARMVFGLARSFIHMGEDGVLFKRFLLKDPYNPVSVLELIGQSLWKFLFFYLALLALAVNLLRSAGNRRLLALLAVGGLPVVVFGVFWQGGDMERYLPLYPFLFLAVGGVLAAKESWRPANAIVAGFFLVLVVVVNAAAHGRWEIGRLHRAMTDRVEDLKNRLKPGSLVVVVKDSLKLLPRELPFDRATRGLPIVEAVTPGQADAPRWRSAFRDLVETSWKKGGDVWISRRLLAAAPPASSAWVEGDDPRVPWSDVHEFFRRLEVGESVGGEDGFVMLLDSPRTRQALAVASP